METEVLIIGAGLAGLSAGYHLTNRPHMIVESDRVKGGLCKSFAIDGFHFDCTGHLIHFRTATGRDLVTKLMGDQIEQHHRKSAIYLQGRYTDYPFQANTYGLPPEVIKECVLGFVETLTRKKSGKIRNFHDWIYDTFGAGIAKYFMVPYNEKLWQHDLRDVALDWVNWSIPKPNLEDVLNGALGIKNKDFGYNPVFYYPARGGIGSLPNSFPVYGELKLDNPVVAIHLRKRRATLRNGEQIQYRYLFSTMPLHSFLAILQDSNGTFAQSRDKLKYVSVLNLNLGVDRPNVIPYHWIYFPERDKPFYRIGSSSNFSNAVAPDGTSSLYVEVSLRPNEQQDVKRLTEDCIEALCRCQILRDDDRIVAKFPVLLQYAYVVYDTQRKRTVERVQRLLQSYDVYTFGRYGSWIYSSMEDAILEGKEHAEKITQRVQS